MRKISSRSVGIGIVVAMGAVLLTPAPAAADAAPPRDISRFACPADLPDPFTDTWGSVHERAIRCLTAYEMINGTTSTTFSPSANVTRAQLASFLVRMAFGEDVLDPIDQGFTDIAGNPHRDNINILAELGVINGLTPTSFGPNRPVTRAQAAAMVFRLLDILLVLPPGPDAFNDDNDSQHESAINALAAAGIVGGATRTTFRPSDRLTRGAIASILARAQDLAVENGLSLPPGETESILAALTGENEVPGPGDNGAMASVELIRTSVEGLLCFTWDIDAGFSDDPVGAHVHEAATGAAGPILLTLPAPTATAGERVYESGCVADLQQAMIDEVFANPEGYYVNIHTAEFPDGAVRGQLSAIATTLAASLSGEAVPSSAGEAGAVGLAFVGILDDGETVCVAAVYFGESTPTAAHIHGAASGAVGATEMTFPPFDAADPVADGCVSGLAPALLADLAANPGNHYVDIHTAAHSGGAVRGQLEAIPGFAPASVRPSDGWVEDNP